MNDYDAIRKLLNDRFAELEGRAGRIDKDVRHEGSPLPADSVEQRSIRANDEVLDGLNLGARAEMEQINSALARMDSGEYGVCISCGEAIPIKRLEALPYAVRCVDCAD